MESATSACDVLPAIDLHRAPDGAGRLLPSLLAEHRPDDHHGELEARRAGGVPEGDEGGHVVRDVAGLDGGVASGEDAAGRAPEPAAGRRRPRPARRSRLVAARCDRCGDRDDVTADLILPRSHGGWDDDLNRRPLCGRCREQRIGRRWTDRPATGPLRTLLGLPDLRGEIRALLAAAACAAEAHFAEGQPYDRAAYADRLEAVAGRLAGPYRTYRTAEIVAFDEAEEAALDGQEGVDALCRAIDELLPTPEQAQALASRRPEWRWLAATRSTARGTARPPGTPVRSRRKAA